MPSLRVAYEEKEWDINVVPDGLSINEYRLLCIDLDSTLIETECLDILGDLVGRGDLVFVDDRIDRQVGAHTGGMCRRYDARQVVEREVGGRCRPHVEFPDPEVDGVGAGLDGCGERFVAPHGSHDFDIGAFQAVALSEVYFCAP